MHAYLIQHIGGHDNTPDYRINSYVADILNTKSAKYHFRLMFSSVYVGLIIDELTHCPYFVAVSTVVFGITLFIAYKIRIKHLHKMVTGVLPDSEVIFEV